MSTSPRRTVPLVAAIVVTAVLALVPVSPGTAGAQEAVTNYTPLAELYQTASGNSHTCAIDDNDEVYCWGGEFYGELGNGPTETDDQPTPDAVATSGTALDGKSVEQLAVGYTHACALTADDAIACWGRNNQGQLGDGTTDDADAPVAVALAGTPLDGKDITAIAAAVGHTCALASDGTIACWGLNNGGQLGDGTTTDRLEPVALTTAGTPLDGLDIAQLDAAGFNTCALSTTGVLGCVGDGGFGQLGVGTTTDATTATSPISTGTALDGKTIEAVALGRYLTCVLLTDGTVSCWGSNDSGQVGDGTTTDRTTPVAVATAGTGIDGKAVAQVAAQYEHVCVRTTDHVLACWGEGDNGSLGNEFLQDRSTPTLVEVTGTDLATTDLDDLAVGDNITCATHIGAAPWCWGRGGDGQLGNDRTGITNLWPSAVILDPSPPSAPTVTHIEAEPGGISIDWTHPIDLGGTEVREWQIDVYYESLSRPVLTETIGAFGGSSDTFIELPGDNTYRVKVSARNYAGWGPASAYSASVYVEPTVPNGAAYVPMTPCRILDTRKVGGTLANREIRDISVADDARVAAQGGHASGCDVPADALGVEASITAVDPADSGFFRAWPAGQAMPNATFMNFDRGMDITNTGSIAIEPMAIEGGATTSAQGDQLRIRNFGGASHYVIDVQGFYLLPPRQMEDGAAPNRVDPGDTAVYVPVTPCRILDTRQAGGTIADREIRDISVADDTRVAAQGGKPSGCDLPPEALAIEASIAAVDPLDSGFFRAWPAGESMPNATFMNFDLGMDITNTGSIAIAPGPLRPSGATGNAEGDQLRIRNFGGASHYVIDVQGVWMPGFKRKAAPGEATTSAVTDDPSLYEPMTPCRVLDTRKVGGTIADREIRDIAFTDDARVEAQGGKAGGCNIPVGTVAVEASITAVSPLDSGFFRAWPAGESMPNATFMNFDRGMDITNTGSLTIAIDEQTQSGAVANAAGDELRIRNFGGASHYVIDIQGYYPGIRQAPDA